MDERDGFRMRIRIVAAVAAGFLAGSVGLASAGALPAGTQEVAHDALGAVGVTVPRPERYQGPECGGDVKKNHGQYVRSQPKEKRAEAAASRCGKPVQAGQGEADADEGTKPEKAPKAEKAPNAEKPTKRAECKGKPPWAGKGKPDQAARDAWKQTCKPQPSTTTTTG
jgi:hypothetical protein